MKNQKGFTIVELLLCILAVFSFIFVCGIGYILFHFISKFW